MDDTIDNVIAQVSQENSEETPSSDVVDTPVSDENTGENQETLDDGEETDDTPFPKKAVNALNRREKQINKLKAANQQYMQDLQQLRQQMESFQAQFNAPKEPNQNDYDDYDKYVKDLAIYHSGKGQDKQESLDPEQIKQQAYQEAQQAVYLQQREQATIEKANEYIGSIPDYKDVIMEYEDVFDEMPDATAAAFYQAEDPAIAFYAMAKDGIAESLLNMTPQQVAYAVAKYEMKGKEILKQRANKVSQAKPPIQGVRGSGGLSSLDDLIAKDPLAWLNS